MKMFKKIISMALALSMLMIPISAKAASGLSAFCDANGDCTVKVYGNSGDTVDIYYQVDTVGNQILDSNGSGIGTADVKKISAVFDSNGEVNKTFNIGTTSPATIYVYANGEFDSCSYTPASASASPTPTDTPAPTNTPANMPLLASAPNTWPSSCVISDTVDMNDYVSLGTNETITNVYTDNPTYTSISNTTEVTFIKGEFEGKAIVIYTEVTDSVTSNVRTESFSISSYGKLDTSKGFTIQDNHPSYRIYTAGETLDVTDLDTYVYIAYSLDSNGNPVTKRENIKAEMAAEAATKKEVFFSYTPSLTTPLTTDVNTVTCDFTYPNGLNASTTQQATFNVTVSSSSGITITPYTGKVGDTVNLKNLINPIEAQKDCVITLKDQLMSEVDKTNGDYKLEKAGTATFEVKRKNADVVVGTVTINPVVVSFDIKTPATKTVYQEGEYYNPEGMTGEAWLRVDNTTQTSVQKTDFVPKTDFTFTPSLTTKLTTANTTVVVEYLGVPADTIQTITVNVLTTLDKPTIQVTGSKTDKTRTVSMSCTNGLGTILYTTDGSDPKTSSTNKQYSGAFDVTASTTIKAYVRADNSSSQTIKSEVETMSIVVSEKKGTVYNCRTSVNVRSGPGTNYSKIGVAKKGTVYSITGESGNWYQIDYNGTTGYISKSYMKVTTTGGDLTGTGTIVNCKHKVNVRKGPGTNYGRRGYAYLGETYNLLALDHDSQGRDWYMVQYGTTTGYIYGKYIQTSATPTPITSKNVKVSNCSQWVNVRSGPSTSYAKVGRAYLGDVYALEDWYGGNGFAKVTYVNKVTGEVRAASYISTKYLTPSN